VKITRIVLDTYAWKRAMPLTNGLHTYTGVQHALVRVETDEGLVGYGIGGNKQGEREHRVHFARRLIGRDPLMTEAVWADLWMPKKFGRRGFETRALAALDLALWDLKGKRAGLPVHQLLGGFRTLIPTYVAGGYYADGKGLPELQAEMAGYVERGARAVKMKVGAVSIVDDVARIRAVRQAIGPDVRLMIDLFWFEEPVQPDDYDGFRRIAAASTVPLAAGENESTIFGFRDLIATGAMAVLQPDARHEGITGFMKIAALAQAHGLDICPHGDQQAHLALMAAIPNGLMIEYYPREFDPMHGRVYLHTPMLRSDGCVEVPSVPGIGADPNEAELAPLRTSSTVIDGDGVVQL
jgi:L-alanine-DL-glutamate epimerase-like enolase superfamily enzyme